MIIDVAVPVRVNTSFHYLMDLEMCACPPAVGAVIEVPFRNTSTYAFVIGFPEKTKVPADKLKTVGSVLVSESLFDEKMLSFLRWISEYYCHPLGEVILTAFPKAYWEKKAKTKSSPKSSVVGEEIVFLPPPELTEEQTSVLEKMRAPGEKRPILLHGVTGSGKTEIYMRILQDCLDQGKGGIVLVPEIALTPQLAQRFCGRFGEKVAVLHSDMTKTERFSQWEKIKSGQAAIAVGARSAVFAPVKNLGVLIVDEEHETTFKQEDSLRYHARDLAVMRGNIWDAKVILGSATPSLESYQHAQSGKYLYLQLKKRVNNRPLPKTFFVDLKDTYNLYSPKMPWLTKGLVAKMEQTLARKQQVLLYLNRLGFAHFLFCSDCGHSWRCRNCDVALTYYQNPAELKCHYCGLHGPVPHQCSECKGDKLQTIGLGTEQVERQLCEVFPGARVGRMDRSQIKTRKELESVLKTIANRELDIIVGTQMVTKGHDFPGIALVGVLLADASLNLPDFRANERTFQIVTQVSGRAGRADIPGEVVIQTVNPSNPIFAYAAENNAEGFYLRELECRRLFGFPPFRRLAMLRFQHKQVTRVESFSLEVTDFVKREIVKSGLRCSILGPSEAPLSKLKNYFRWQSLVKGHSVKDVQQLLRAVNEYVAESKSGVGFAVDVDPIHSL